MATNGMFFHESAMKIAVHARQTLMLSQARLDQAGWNAPRM